MILNGMRHCFLEGGVGGLYAATAFGGAAALIAGTAAAIPVAAGFGVSVAAVIVSSKIRGFIQDAIFKHRVDNLEKFAKNLGLNPNSVDVEVFRTRTISNVWNSLSTLTRKKEDVNDSNKFGSTCNDYRISREAVMEAKKNMREMASQLQQKTATHVFKSEETNSAISNFRSTSRPGPKPR